MTGEAPTIPVVFCIDVEPDERLVDRSHPAGWTGFERMFEHVSAVRKRLADRYNVSLRLSWLLRMDPQVKETHGDAAWAAEHYARPIAEAASLGDAFGLHIHAYRWDDGAGNWIADHANRQWIDECVEISADAFRRAFHRPCVAYRMGDRYIDEPTLARMESLGGRVDLTAEPGYPASPAVFVEQPHTGSLPDLSAVPRRTYRPSREDFRRADPSGERTIWILPLTTWKVSGLLAIARRVYFLVQGLRQAPLPDAVKRQPMMTLALSLPPLYFRHMLDDLLAAESVPHLVSIDRTHVANDPSKLDRIEVNLRHMLSHPAAHRFVFVRPEEVVDFPARGCDSVSLGGAAV